MRGPRPRAPWSADHSHCSRRSRTTATRPRPPRNAVPENWPEFTDDLDGIDKEIAHLTYLRPPKPTQWDINNKLTPRLIRFIWAVEGDRVQEGFKVLAYAALVDTTDFVKALLSGGLLSGRVSGPVATQTLQPASSVEPDQSPGQ